MRVALLKYPVESLGPGKRVGIWISGCSKNCKGCMSEYAKDYSYGIEMSVEDIIGRIKEYSLSGVDGVTVSGGEPFDSGQLKCLLEAINALGIEDVLVYTGYTLEEIDDFKSFIGLIGVLIDGPYVEELNDDMPLRGSSNQRIFILKKELAERYSEYLAKPRQFQLCFEDDKVIVIGILPKNGKDILDKIIKNG